MARYAAALLLLCSAACSSCSTFGAVVLPGIPLEIDPTLAITTPDGGAGHACPVDGLVITARHIIYDEDHDRYITGVAWSDGYGREGICTEATPSPTHDVAILQIENPPFDFLPRGLVIPGDEVFWFEYDFRTRANALRSRRRVAHVLRIVGQQIVFDDTPVGGASGTCLINSAGEVVGIVNAEWSTDDGRNVGTAVKVPAPNQEETR